MPNFRTYSVFLVSSFLLLSNGKWEFYVSIFVMLYVYLFCFRLVPMVWCKALGDSIFFFAGTIDFLFFLLVYAWCFVNCQSNLQYFVKTESGSICLILPKMWRYCHKKCVLAFFLFNTPCHQKTWFFFFARFYFYMYISCSLDCSIYHWKLVIHQSIKNKYSYKKNLKLIFKAKHLPISTHVHTNLTFFTFEQNILQKS